MSTTTATKTKNPKNKQQTEKLSPMIFNFFRAFSVIMMVTIYVKLALIKSKNRIYKTCSEYGYFLKNRIKKKQLSISKEKPGLFDSLQYKKKKSYTEKRNH